ncbi:ATP-binding protein, partial [Streptomyces sp. NPDC004658]
GRRGTEDGAGGRHGGAPAPLPVRGAQEARPTPAGAAPGIGAEDRAAVEAHTGVLPTPRGGPVRGTMDKPRLPRRRAQEHIVPQLRGGPLPRQESDTVAGHDPGLMAAFQRGIGLAEAQQSLESEHQEPAYENTAYENTAHGHMGSAHMDAGHMDAGHMTGAHLPVSAPGPTEPTRARPEHRPPDGTGSQHTGREHTGQPHRGADYTRPGHTAQPATTPLSTPAPATPLHPAPDPASPAPIPQAHAHAPAVDGVRGTGRTEGSAPAG